LSKNASPVMGVGQPMQDLTPDFAGSDEESKNQEKKRKKRVTIKSGGGEEPKKEKKSRGRNLW